MSALASPARLTAALWHLAEIIDQRAAAGQGTDSWTARLIASGPDACAAKIEEEAGEFAAAVRGEAEARVASEAGDVIYHLLVGLRVRGVPLDAVARALEARQGQSGLAEKAGRKKPAGN